MLGPTDGGEVLAGMLLDGVVAGTLVSVPSSLLLQPEISAIVAAADEMASRPTRPARWEFFTADVCPEARLRKLRVGETSPTRQRWCRPPGEELQAFDDGGVGHAAALTHRLQCEASVPLLEGIDHRGHDASTASRRACPDHRTAGKESGIGGKPEKLEKA